MLKVTGSKMKITTRPSKAVVVAKPAGFEARKQRWAEEDERARQYKATYYERMYNGVNAMNAANAARHEATRAEREAKREEQRRKPRRMWDNYEEIAIIQKSDRLQYLVSACTRDGFRCVSIREFYLRKKDNQWMPSRNGILIPLASPINRNNDQPIKIIHPMQELLSALVQAAEFAQEMDLADPEKAIWLKYDNKEENNNENQ